jgi:flagellar biosynthesis protein FlhA
MNRNLAGTIGYSAIALLLIVVTIAPIPAVFLDFLITINIIFSFLLLLESFANRKNSDYTVSPRVIIMFIVFNLGINMTVTRQILTIGEYFDVRAILFFVSPFAGIGEIGLAAGLIFITACSLASVIFTTRVYRRISEKAFSYSQSLIPKLTAIDAEYEKRTITDEEAADRKNAIREETEYFNDLERTGRDMAGFERLRIAFIVINSVGGVLIGTKLRGELISDAFEVYVSIAAGSAVVSLIPSLMLASAVWLATRPSKIPLP